MRICFNLKGGTKRAGTYPEAEAWARITFMHTNHLKDIKSWGFVR